MFKLILLFLFFICYSATSFSFERSAWVDKFYHSLAKAQSELKIPGVAAAIVDKNNVVAIFTNGVVNGPDSADVNNKTLFSIQSQSKMFTALGVMFAIQAGKLNLDQSVSNYLPWFHPHTRFKLNPEKRITLRLLLSHKAGLAHEAPIGNNYNPGSPGFMDHIKSVNQTWLRFPVGQRFAYSNIGYDLVGAIIQTKMHMLFPNYMKKYVLVPLGMLNSTYKYSVMKKSRNYAIGHVLGVKNLPGKIPMIAAGGMYSNIVDMIKFLHFELCLGKINNKQLLEKRYLLEQQKIVDATAQQYDGYGLGLFVTDYHHNKILGHAGGGFGFNSISLWSVDSGIGVVILTNKESDKIATTIRDIAVSSIRRYIDAVNEKSLSPLHPNKNEVFLKFSHNRFDKFLGHYIGSHGSFTLERCKSNLCISYHKKTCQLRFLGNKKFLNLCNRHKIKMRRKLGAYNRYIIDVSNGKTWNFNGGNYQPLGKLNSTWKSWLGVYQVPNRTNVPRNYRLSEINGYLYFGKIQLKHYKDNIFFGSSGKTFIEKGGRFYWNNVPIKKLKNK